MRRGVLIQERDLSILKCLHFGPCVARGELSDLFLSPASSGRTRLRLMARRLTRLEDAGFLKTCESSCMRSAVYGITRKGAGLVEAEFGWPAENAWIVKPREDVSLHDLYVALAARLCWRTLPARGPFCYHEILNERALKSLAEAAKARPRAYPDLTVRVKQYRRLLSADVEICRGTRGAEAMEAKFCAGTSVMLVLVETVQRLQWYYEKFRDRYLRRPVYVSELEKLRESGIYHDEWIALPNGHRCRLTPEVVFES